MRRHSGVLGLAALVEACPYSVPEWLPEVLIEIAAHNHDPAPIQVFFLLPFYLNRKLAFLKAHVQEIIYARWNANI